MNKKHFRISYSLLSLWGQGLVDQAINTYFHLEGIKSPQVAEGRRLHQEWADTIKKEKKLTLGATTLSFTAPLTEFGSDGELNKPYNELWDIGGRFDVLDGDVIYEFKSGVKDALDYAGDYQIPFYFLLAELAEIKIDKAIIVHLNQYIDKADLVIVYNNPLQIDRARNFTDSIAPEIYTYFLNNGLL